MTNLEKIRNLNPTYDIKFINADNFKFYGRIHEADLSSAIEKVNNYTMNVAYLPSVDWLEECEDIKAFAKHVYGGLDACCGIVTGKNQVLNGVEYHQGSETIVAITDYVLAVGHLWDMHDNHYDGSKVELFYVPAGTIVECYQTTLHYTPICVDDNGFKTLCFLLRGTGDPIERDGILKKKNKWFAAHASNIDKIKSGDLIGLDGQLIKVEH